MKNSKYNILFVLVALVLASACTTPNSGSQATANSTQNKNAPIGGTPAVSGKSDNSDDKITASNQTEKQKPAAGKGSVQGTIFYNSKPAEGIEVKLCEKLSTIMGVDCTGKTIEAKTDKDGVFVLADADPQIYEGLTARVFKTDFYVYPQEGIMTAQKFNVAADKTIFASDINLFKSDLKITNPKAGSKIDAKGLEFKWDAYPDAAYYKVSLYADDSSVLSPYAGERVEGTSFAVDKTLTNGKYTINIEGYNADDKKLVESSGDIKFTVTGGEEPAAK
ncbi:MAG: hypothetical protein H0X15_15750 [Acidobacteria bacterium]|nr:hypothetical protein [Acidobacteriota bacterium]